MRRLYTKAYAKLNLSLDITGLRPDGYHELIMVMQTTTLYDNVALERLTEADGIRSHSNLRYIPNDNRNLAVKAASAFFEYTGIRSGVSINIKKNIPVGSGMGGGSADAAAVLRGLNQMHGFPLDRKALEDLGATVGSDVPFCIAGGTQLAEGRGEILKDLPPLPDCSIVICKPAFSISTPELYRRIDDTEILHHPDTPALLRGLEAGDLKLVAENMYNVFEETPLEQFVTVRKIRQCLSEHGALGSMMTGSGSAVFGIFEDAEKAARAQEDLKTEYPFCFLVRNRKAIRLR